MTEGSKIIASVYNYYGCPYVIIKDGDYYIGIEDWNYPLEKKISKEFYEAWKKEFSK